MNNLNPSVVKTTVERSGGTQEPSTEVSTQTTYWIEQNDTVNLSSYGLEVSRGRYYEQNREEVRINCHGKELEDAVVAYLRVTQQLATEESNSEFTRKSASERLERFKAAVAGLVAV